MNSMMGSKGMRGSSGHGTDIVPSGYKTGQLQQFSPEQQKLFSQLFGLVSPGSYLSKLSQGDEDVFRQIEGPAHRQLASYQGDLASRFSGMGSGARRSSGFQNMATAAQSNLSQDLASRRQQLQQQAIMDLMGLGSQLLGQRPQERFLVEKKQKPKSFLEELLLGLSGGFGQGLGTAAGGLF